jgi:zinc-ribbon domain
VKNCTKCGAEAADDIKFCSQCGFGFAVVGDAEVVGDGAQLGSDQACEQLVVRTSPWVKISAVCLITLTGLFGCQQIRSSQLASCRENAPLIQSFHRVLDVRLNGFQCEYLMIDNLTPEVPEWEPQHIFDMYMRLEKKINAPNQ